MKNLNSKVSLQAISQIRSLWDTIKADDDPHYITQFDESGILDRLAQLFCCGAYYFYVFDFTDLTVRRFSPSIFEVVDLAPDTLSVESFMHIMHPQDRVHFQTCETVVRHFLFEKINSPDILNYKVAYFFRLRKPNGDYHIFHHQTVALSLDKNRRIHRVIGVHTDVDHLFNTRPRQLSFTHLNGGDSYLKVDPDNPDFSQGVKKISMISARECQILEHFSQGLTDEEVGEALSISHHTVRKHRDNIRKKLSAKNTTHAVSIALKNGWI